MEEGVFDPVEEEDDEGSPPVALKLTTLMETLRSNDNDDDDLEARTLMEIDGDDDDDDDDATRPAALVASRQNHQPMDQDYQVVAQRLMAEMLQHAGVAIPFICIAATAGAEVGTVTGGLGTATFCHVAKYLHQSYQRGMDYNHRPDDMEWAARLVAYASVRDHHTVPVPRDANRMEFQNYTERVIMLKAVAERLVSEQPNCCVAIQEDCFTEAGMGRILLFSSFDARRQIWGVLKHFFSVLKFTPPFYRAEEMDAELASVGGKDEQDMQRLFACWNEIQQELNARRVMQAHNNI